MLEYVFLEIYSIPPPTPDPPTPRAPLCYSSLVADALPTPLFSFFRVLVLSPHVMGACPCRRTKQAGGTGERSAGLPTVQSPASVDVCVISNTYCSVVFVFRGEGGEVKTGVFLFALFFPPPFCLCLKNKNYWNVNKKFNRPYMHRHNKTQYDKAGDTTGHSCTATDSDT